MKRTELKRRTPLARSKKWLKHTSASKATHKKAVDPLRHAFARNKQFCELCGLEGNLETHEIGNGAAKEECEKHPGLWIALARECHDKVQGWPKAKQLALRWLRDLQTLNRIRGRAPNAITWDEVMDELEHLINSGF